MRKIYLALFLTLWTMLLSSVPILLAKSFLLAIVALGIVFVSSFIVLAVFFFDINMFLKEWSLKTNTVMLICGMLSAIFYHIGIIWSEKFVFKLFFLNPEHFPNACWWFSLFFTFIIWIFFGLLICAVFFPVAMHKDRKYAFHKDKKLKEFYSNRYHRIIILITVLGSLCACIGFSISKYRESFKNVVLLCDFYKRNEVRNGMVYQSFLKDGKKIYAIVTNKGDITIHPETYLTEINAVGTTNITIEDLYRQFLDEKNFNNNS